MEKTKKILNVVFVMMLIITIIVINRTYALFESSVDLTIKMDVAKWNITVNDALATSNSVQSFVIKNLQLEANSKVENGKVAPGSKGTFDVEMDFKDTDVSVMVELKIDDNKMKAYGLKYNGYTLDDNNITLQEISNKEYYFIVPLTTIKNAQDSYKLKMSIEFEWENDENRNKEDTLIGTSEERQKMQIPITLKFTQYTGI